jgi:hypothetical protein
LEAPGDGNQPEVERIPTSMFETVATTQPTRKESHA